MRRPEVHLRIFDLNGRLIKSVLERTGDVIVMALNDLSDGIYLYELSTKGSFLGSGNLIID